MNKIQVANILLTRKCNLKCNYCAITKNYKNMPSEYPQMKHYYENEMSTEYVIEMLRLLKLHNPDVFVILYGGEPLLRPDLSDIINYCNGEDIQYTIITNNTPEVQEKFEDLLTGVHHIQGLTSSIDPLGIDEDSKKKSQFGLEKLKYYKDFIKDVVAEITVSKHNVYKLYDTVKLLTDHGISSSITFIDIAKTPYYDFSNITDDHLLVKRTEELEHQIFRIIADELDVHMGEELLPVLLDNLPSEYDCGLEKGIHNITVDADGTVRLCLRIRGVLTPKLKINECFNSNGELNPALKNFIINDKQKYCRKCNWSCVMMTNLITSKKSKTSDLIHSDRR